MPRQLSARVAIMFSQTDRQKVLEAVRRSVPLEHQRPTTAPVIRQNAEARLNTDSAFFGSRSLPLIGGFKQLFFSCLEELVENGEIQKSKSKTYTRKGPKNSNA